MGDVREESSTVAEDLKQLSQRFYDAVNAGDMDAAMSLVADDFREYEEFPGIPSNRDGVRQFFEMMRSAFPDFSVDVEDMLVEGDKVAVRMQMTGTHEGEFLGMQSTGRRFSVTGIDIVRVVDGKAVEHWGATDTMGMMQQLGAMSGSAPAGGSA